jgi:apolipoprotein N-acyltransferase
VLEGRVQGRVGTTPYVAAGDYPVVLACLAVLAAAALTGRGRTQKSSGDADLRA